MLRANRCGLFSRLIQSPYSIALPMSSMTFFAGLDNELFYMDKTMMVFGDAKKVIEDMGKAIE